MVTEYVSSLRSKPSWTAVAAATAFRLRFIRQKRDGRREQGGSCCYRSPRRFLINSDGAHLHGIRDKALAALECVLEVWQAVGATVHESPGGGQIVVLQSLPNLVLLGAQESGQDSCGDLRIARQIGVLNKLVAQTDNGRELSVVGAAGKLNEPASLKIRAVGRPQVAELRSCDRICRTGGARQESC